MGCHAHSFRGRIIHDVPLVRNSTTPKSLPRSSDANRLLKSGQSAQGIGLDHDRMSLGALRNRFHESNQTRPRSIARWTDCREFDLISRLRQSRNTPHGRSNPRRREPACRAIPFTTACWDWLRARSDGAPHHGKRRRRALQADSRAEAIQDRGNRIETRREQESVTSVNLSILWCDIKWHRWLDFGHRRRPDRGGPSQIPWGGSAMCDPPRCKPR